MQIRNYFRLSGASPRIIELIPERLYAVAYGCALRSTDDVQIGMLAQAVYDRVFRDGKLPTHILLRDYARGVVEYGLYRGTKLDVEPNKIRPPYETDWLTNVPEPDVIEEYGKWSEEMPDQEWSRVAIYSSVIAHGDFCRNVLEDAVNNWTSLRLDEPRWLSFEEKVQEFVSSLTTLQRDKWRVYQEARQRSQESWRSIQSILVELSDEELQTIIESASDRGKPVGIQNDEDESANEAPDADEFEIQTAKRDFSRALGKKKLEVFEKQIAPFLNGSLSRDFPPSFDLTLAQRWIVQQVFEMGWTLERFGRFDRQLDRRQNLEEVHKAESIGEKYQWIAYHEFLARLADNFQFREPYSSHPQSHCYDGPWQFHGRDIDPSCVLKTTGRGSNWRRTAKAWWFSNEYDAWDAIVDDVEWMNATLDLPDVQSFIEVIKPDDRSKWLALDGFYHWEQPAPPEEERYEKVRREMQYVLHGYLVHRADCSELFRWTAQQDFESLRMPKNQSIYRMYLGEFYWSPAYRYFTDPYEGYAGWCGGEPDSRIPKPILPLVETYAQENSGFDCSIDDNISIIVPAQFIVERMGLESRGMDGKYYDDTGTLIAFDPSVDENGPQTLLVLKDTFLSFLKENEFCIIWTILGEKQLIGGGLRHDNWKGRLEISGACCMKEGRFESTINPRFHSPQDRVQL